MNMFYHINYILKLRLMGTYAEEAREGKNLKPVQRELVTEAIFPANPSSLHCSGF